MNFLIKYLIIILMVSSHLSTKAKNFSNLKDQLNQRQIIELEYKDYSNIDYRTQQQKKQDRKRRTNFGKKFGPLKMGFKVRNIRNSNINFNLDLIEAHTLLKNSNNLQEFYKSVQPDKEHKFINPELKAEIIRIINNIRPLAKPKVERNEVIQKSQNRKF